MTTRVQKGGPVFKPVARSRTRLTSTCPRQASTPADVPAFIASQSSRNVLTPAPMALPPIHPTSAPSDGNELESRVDMLVSVQPPSNSTSIDLATPISTADSPQHKLSDTQPASSCTEPAIPNFAPDIDSSSRITSRPPSIINQPTVLMGICTTDQALSHLNETFVYAPESQNVVMPKDGSLMGVFQALAPTPYAPPDTATLQASQNTLNNFHTGNALRLALNADNSVKPRRITGRKKESLAEVEDIMSGCTDPTTEEMNGESSTGKTKVKTRGTRAKESMRGDNQGRPIKKKRITRREVSEEVTTEEMGQKLNRKMPNETPRLRKSRTQRHRLFDADVDPGEDIDPTVVTMAALCSDTGQGRVSRKAAEIQSNHAAWKAQNREKRARMKSVLELKKYGRDEAREQDNTNQSAAVTPQDPSVSSAPRPLTSSTPTLSGGTAVEDHTGNGFDYSQDLVTSRFNVQVRIGPNGETIIDEESLVVDRNDGGDTETYNHVVESDNTKFVNSGSYGKRYRGSRWSTDETERFFDALSQFGENYELIAYVLPGRDRKSCKNKFKVEDKKNHLRIDYCLNNRIPVDVETLSRMTGKNFSGPIPEIHGSSPQAMGESQTLGDHSKNNTTNNFAREGDDRSEMVSTSSAGEIIGDAETFDQ